MTYCVAQPQLEAFHKHFIFLSTWLLFQSSTMIHCLRPLYYVDQTLYIVFISIMRGDKELIWTFALQKLFQTRRAILSDVFRKTSGGSSTTEASEGVHLRNDEALSLLAIFRPSVKTVNFSKIIDEH